MLADTEVQAFHEGGVDNPAHTLGQQGLDCFQAAIDNPMANRHDTALEALFDNLGILELGQRQPTGLGQRAA